MRPTIAALLLATSTAALSPALAADVFSPGDLSRAHAALSGLDSCTKCHPAGEQLSQQRCLECHQELAPRIAGGKGFHGRLAPKDRDCWSCHHEHQGREFVLVDWGSGGQRRFDHARTGLPLAGKHAQAACEKCHDPRLVADPPIKALLAKEPRRRTFLGAPAMGSCASCHSDEHRGQLGPDCKRCHGENAWKPAPGFDHARTEYPLTGRHTAVACDKCHSRIVDTPTARGSATPVVATRNVRYRPVAHASCADCHRDVHEGRLGATCSGCHGTDGWRRIVSTDRLARSFHDRTRYPLQGAHLAVRCIACHGPFPGEAARFKGLGFQACTDCHADAHAGQLARRDGTSPDCSRCHDVNGFQPARFGPEDHDRTAYRLEGAHRVVACASCHPADPSVADRMPATIRSELQRRGRPVRTALSVYRIAGDLGRCETCHEDTHRGQLVRAEGCAACHGLQSFANLRPPSPGAGTRAGKDSRGEGFDHTTGTRFSLSGKHATAACAACHRRDPGTDTVRYRPLALTCGGCHADPHAGQLVDGAMFAAHPTGAAPRSAAGCDRCHDTASWKAALFRHSQPFTSYALTGKHAQLACEKCHGAVEVAPGVRARRYRPLPSACEDCHADFHKGAFHGLEKIADTRCDRCHTTTAWRDAAFAHDRAGFPLRGAHTRISCQSCHAVSFTRALGRECASCHRDMHQGRLGTRCASCHDEDGWRTRFDADAHRRGNFPLVGRHAFIPCEECHGDRRDLGFARSTPACIACHQRDYDRTAAGSVDHRAAGFSTQCQQCHQPWRFVGASFPQHDACFQISSGRHAGIPCLKCHTSLSGFSSTGQCSTLTAACTRCHSCGSHPQVAGFGCVDRKCYECHRFSTVSTGNAALRASPRRSP